MLMRGVMAMRAKETGGHKGLPAGRVRSEPLPRRPSKRTISPVGSRGSSVFIIKPAGEARRSMLSPIAACKPCAMR